MQTMVRYDEITGNWMTRDGFSLNAYVDIFSKPQTNFN